MKNQINFSFVILLCYLTLPLNSGKYSTEKIQNNKERIKLGFSFEKKNSRGTKIKFLIRRKNLEIIDLGTYKGDFHVKNLGTQEKLPLEFNVSADRVVINFKLYRKSGNIILKRTTSDLIHNKIETTILKTIAVGESNVSLLRPVEVKENPRAL